jgi:type IV pilus assembly protein PilB
MVTTVDRNLGDILVQAALITPEQLQDVLELQQQKGGDLGQIMVEQNLITAQELASLTGLQWNIPFVDVTQQKIQPETMALIPEAMAKKYNLVPLEIADGALIVAMEQPWNIETIGDLTMQTKMTIRPMLAVASDIEKTIELNYTVSSELEEQISHISTSSARQRKEREHVSADAIAQAPVVRTVGLIVGQAVKDRASDIHIEPQEDRLRIRYRIDGILHDVMSLPLSIHLPLTSRLKIMAGMNIADRRRPQDGQFSIKVDDKEVDIRVASSDTVQGETLVLRILDKSFALLELSQLGFMPDILGKYRQLINSPFGMILISGPTGSGKTTTLYASVNRLNHNELNIMTIEDPVEYHFNNITQIQVNARAGMTFANGLRALMRETVKQPILPSRQPLPVTWCFPQSMPTTLPALSSAC